MRALIVTPNAADADLARAFLAEHAIDAAAYEGVEQLGGELPPGAGCIVIAEEALLEGDLHGLGELLRGQPAWSDPPLILVASHGASLESLLERGFPEAGNVTLLERPLNPISLVSAVQAGLRARARQLEVRDLLEKREQAVRQRDDFLAMLAHELRNPLAPMRNAVYLQKTLPAGGEILERTREILERQITHLARLVDDLIDVARLERGKINLQRQRLDLNAAVTSAIDACLPVIHARGHRVRMALAGEPLYAEADPVRVEQLLSNLLGNACKFTPEGGQIEVRSRRDGAMAAVEVRDNGVGIRADRIETMFDAFAQGDQTLARSTGGLGVGLSIARRIAELHGGTLTGSSEGLDRGCVFEMRLPLTASQAASPEPSPTRAAAARRRRVLVVEDNADIRDTLRLVLDHWGHEVMLAASGDEGLVVALRERPEVGLIDIGLPGMSGYELAQRIRAGAAGWPSPVKLVALTGYGQPSDRERSRGAGFDSHLLKPVDLDVLRELLAA